MFKGNMSKILKQAQEVQKKIEEVQNELSQTVIDAESGGGMVKVQVNGKQELLNLSIAPEAMNEEVELIEDLIISAVNKALSKSQSDSQEKMNQVTGGMMSGLNIPGL